MKLKNKSEVRGTFFLFFSRSLKSWTRSQLQSIIREWRERYLSVDWQVVMRSHVSFLARHLLLLTYESHSCHLNCFMHSHWNEIPVLLSWRESRLQSCECKAFTFSLAHTVRWFVRSLSSSLVTLVCRVFPPSALNVLGDMTQSAIERHRMPEDAERYLVTDKWETPKTWRDHMKWKTLRDPGKEKRWEKEIREEIRIAHATSYFGGEESVHP